MVANTFEPSQNKTASVFRVGILRMVVPDLGRVEFGEESAPINYLGGKLIPLTRTFPRGDLEGIGTSYRKCHDTDGDGCVDTVTTTDATYVDLDGNGVIERDVDGLLLRVVKAEAILPTVAVFCGPREHHEAIENVRASA